MMECECCGDAVERLLRRREYSASMTHRTSGWLCRSCHPRFATARTGTRDHETGDAAATVATDGGTSPTGCPECSASVANVQGILNCTECSWSGR